MVYGPNWDVDAAETLEPAASAEKWPKGEYFIIDVQTHFTDSAFGPVMGFRSAEFENADLGEQRLAVERVPLGVGCQP